MMNDEEIEVEAQRRLREVKDTLRRAAESARQRGFVARFKSPAYRWQLKRNTLEFLKRAKARITKHDGDKTNEGANLDGGENVPGADDRGDNKLNSDTDATAVANEGSPPSDKP